MVVWRNGAAPGAAGRERPVQAGVQAQRNERRVRFARHSNGHSEREPRTDPRAAQGRRRSSCPMDQEPALTWNSHNRRCSRWKADTWPSPNPTQNLGFTASENHRIGRADVGFSNRPSGSSTFRLSPDRPSQAARGGVLVHGRARPVLRPVLFPLWLRQEVSAPLWGRRRLLLSDLCRTRLELAASIPLARRSSARPAP